MSHTCFRVNAHSILNPHAQSESTFYPQSSESKVKFRKVSNRCKRVLEAAKLTYADKTKESTTSQKLGSRDFWQIANSVLNRGKSVTPPLFNCLEVLKQN